MSTRGRARLLLLVIVAIAPYARAADGPDKAAPADDGSFGMSDPVACKEINGYEDYVALPGAALTSNEKLLVYYLPRHYKTSRVNGKYVAHMTQESRIRRRGGTAVLWEKTKSLEYKVATVEPPRPIYLTNTVALKALKPGEYDYEIILRDEVGKSAPVKKTLPFVVVAPAEASKPNEPDRTK
jgi:hypothetical protein